MAPDGEGTELKMVMDAQARSLSARMTLPLVIGAARKAVEQDSDAVKAFCERPARRAPDDGARSPEGPGSAR